MNLDKYPKLGGFLTGTILNEFYDGEALRSELKSLMAGVDELETVLKLVQRWGKDSRSVGAYEVFAEVTKVLGGKPEHPVVVVDCTCVFCVCPPNKEDRCLGCGARTCMAHTLAKGD